MATFRKDPRVAKGVARKLEDLAALRDGKPPYDAPFDAVKLSFRLVQRLHRIHLHSMRAADVSMRTLATAYDTPGKIERGLELLDAAIGSLDALRAQLRKRQARSEAAE